MRERAVVAGRCPGLIIFNSLSMENIKEIVEIQLGHLRSRLQEKQIEIELTEKAKDQLARDGFDPVYGARPLKRAIQRKIQDPLALAIIEGRFREGDRVIVDADENGEMRFERAETAKVSA